ncbi:MAG: hypothetical protein ACXVCR_13600 [Bdellovibrio sp.]
MKKTIKNALAGIMILSSAQYAMAESSYNASKASTELAKEWTRCMGGYAKNEHSPHMDDCEFFMISGLIPTFWPSVTAMSFAVTTGGISQSLSNSDRRTVKMAAAQAEDLIANYDKSTDNFNVENRQLTENFIKAKGILTSKLNELDPSMSHLGDQRHMKNLDAAMLITMVNNNQ